jgi:glycosyltransferase involved in cell wall biosynthesis
MTIKSPTILFLNKNPPYENSGAAQIIWETGKWLAKKQWDVHYLSPLDDGETPKVENITFHNVRTPKSWFLSRAGFFINGINPYRKIRKKIEPDIIYDNVAPIPFIPAYIQDYNKVVSKIHAVYGMSAIRNKYHPVTKVGTIIFEQMIRTFDGSQIITNSKSTEKRVRKLVSKNPDDIKVVPCGIRVEDFTYNYSPDGPVLCLCALTPRKNVKTLLHAWKILEQENISRQLIIAGDGPCRNKLEKLTNDLSLSNVEFKGYVSEVEKKKLYEKSYCYVLPTRFEGFGLSNIEAMASGCIVISTDTHGVRDYMEHESNGYLIPPDSSKLLAKQIQSVIANSSSNQQIAENGKRTANKYSIKQMVENEEDALYDILENRLSVSR